ncbi:MAG TPA: FecR domain-containing protein [Chryseolinea sp.]|nr:FecR domain-containing protein [Chryseolinea sp.]
MENQPLFKILSKYLNGECTREERAVVEEWFASLDTKIDDSRLADLLAEQALQEKMLAEIKRRIDFTKLPEARPTRARFWAPMRIAATLLLLAIVGYTFVFINRKNASRDTIYDGEASSEVITINNRSESVQEHRLPDGSMIRLQPRGTIEYARQFADNLREVRLIGEAFFDVTKDKTRPFVINAHNVMVKVLGTSFNVRAYEDDPEVKVAVKTGRVSVTRPLNDVVGGGLNEVILTPNQEVVYDMVKENFLKQIVATPQVILAKPTLFHMHYDAMPVDKIFEELEDNYGIDIVFDPRLLSSCTLTTTLEEEGFHERIEIICRAIGATYEVQDARVLIQSAGCEESNN